MRTLIASFALFPLLALEVAHANPGITLDQGRIQATVTSEVNVSDGRAGSPTSIAPDLAVGVTDDLTLSLLHSTFAMTGFRGGAGGGICIADCEHTYDNVAGEALYGLTRGDVSSGILAGVVATSLDRGFVSAKVGGKLRARIDKVTIAAAPSVFLALSHRDDVMRNRDRVWLPVSATYQLFAPLSIGFATGMKAPLDDIAGGYEIAAGLVAQYTFSPQMLIGASWIHGKLLGGDQALPDGTSGWDSRAFQLWFALTR